MKPILVLDDYQAVTKLLSVELSRHGYDVLPFNHPQDALDFLSNKVNAISMLLVDLYMPEINGLDFVSKLRDFPHHHLTPVAFLTSETSENIRKMTLNMIGVYEYITKPIDSKKLLYTIKSCVS
jgi:chemotaxis family two-component system sensor histidine kinase/response regulator PixL